MKEMAKKAAGVRDDVSFFFVDEFFIAEILI